MPPHGRFTRTQKDRAALCRFISALRRPAVAAFRQFEVHEHNLGRSQANGCGSKPHYRIVKTVLKPQETENKDVTPLENLRPEKPCPGSAPGNFLPREGFDQRGGVWAAHLRGPHKVAREEFSSQPTAGALERGPPDPSFRRPARAYMYLNYL